MTDATFSRRALLAAVLLPVPAAPTAARAQLFGSGSQPASATRFHSVAVDVTPLLDHGGGNSARLFSEVLLGEMRTVFADRLGDARGPLLTARITNLYLSVYSGSPGGSDFAFGGNDNIEGDGIVSSGGRVLSSTHILTELPPSYSGAYYTAGIDRIRLQSIAHQFAYWLRREMGL